MKQRSTTPVARQSFARKACIVAAAIMAISSLAPVSFSKPTYADQYDDQIQAIKHQISQNNNTISQLESQKQTLQGALSKLTAQRNVIQGQLDESLVKEAQLKKQIADNQKKLDQNKVLLGQTIANMYVSGNISPLEQLASSDNIATFVDDQANRAQVKETVTNTIQEINKIKAALEKQKLALEQTIKDQKSQRDALVAKEAEKNRLIAETNGKESAFQSLNSKNNARIKKLQQEQAAANQQHFGPAGHGATCGGGYPGVWCNAPQDSVIDNWGMYNRECVSYVAFKVAQSGRHMPYWGGRGNANQWPGSAIADGIPVSSTPRAGDAAIWNVGYYGHAMYVESVNGDGTINVSQYNYTYDGTYSTMTISASGLQFIHFR